MKEKGWRVVRKERLLLLQQTTVCKVTAKSKAVLVLYFKQFIYLCNTTETFNEMRDIRIEKNKEKSFRSNGWVPKFLTRWTMIK